MFELQPSLHHLQYRARLSLSCCMHQLLKRIYSQQWYLCGVQYELYGKLFDMFARYMHNLSAILLSSQQYLHTYLFHKIEQCSSNTKLNVYSNLTSVCDSQLDFQSCAPSCQVCSNSNSSSCLVCKPGYYLILSLFMASCQRKSLLFSCLSTNYVNFNNIVCYNN